MKSRSKTRTRTAPSVRQSVTIPAQLAVEVERVARKNHLTMSRALVVLAKRGVEAEATRNNLNAANRRFMSADDPKRKGEAGKDPIRQSSGRMPLPKIRFSSLPRPACEHILARVEERQISLQDLRRLQD